MEILWEGIETRPKLFGNCAFLQNFLTKKLDEILVFEAVQIIAQKIKFSIKDFFSKCDQIRRKLRFWSHLLKKSLMQNFIFCALRYFKVNTEISPYFLVRKFCGNPQFLQNFGRFGILCCDGRLTFPLWVNTFSN